MKPGGQFFIYWLFLKNKTKQYKKLTKYVFVNLLMDLVTVTIGILLSKMNIYDWSWRIFIDSVITYGKKLNSFSWCNIIRKLGLEHFKNLSRVHSQTDKLLLKCKIWEKIYRIPNYKIHLAFIGKKANSLDYNIYK